MRLGIGILYLATALMGVGWTVYMSLAGLYGVPFSWWYPAMLAGSAALMVGAILKWASSRTSTVWLPFIGSGLLASYFVPAIVRLLTRYPDFLIRQPKQFATRAIVVVFVLASLLAAVNDAVRSRTR
jgi:hypothetical protein